MKKREKVDYKAISKKAQRYEFIQNTRDTASELKDFGRTVKKKEYRGKEIDADLIQSDKYRINGNYSDSIDLLRDAYGTYLLNQEKSDDKGYGIKPKEGLKYLDAIERRLTRAIKLAEADSTNARTRISALQKAARLGEDINLGKSVLEAQTVWWKKLLYGNSSEEKSKKPYKAVAIIGIAGSILFSSFAITGNVIGNPTGKSTMSSIIFLIIGLIGCFAWIKSKKKKK
jgi:hypothetical protein